MDYPTEAIFQNKYSFGAIRLKVAVTCVCLDLGCAPITFEKFTEAEVGPFCEPTYFDIAGGEKYKSILDPHAFAYIEPIGNLAIAVGKILQAMCDSISVRQLPTALLRVGLDSEIDTNETWIFTSDFEDWCECRSLELSEFYGAYTHGEAAIYEAGIENANDRRKQFEAPHFNGHMRTRGNINFYNGEDNAKEYKNLLAEHVSLLSGTYDQGEVERPLHTRERHTLLTIIGLLCNEANYDYKRHAKTAGLLQSVAERMGLNLGETTIENHLKKIPQAMATRMK